jgi:pRiA4b ORF-3-like protein
MHQHLVVGRMPEQPHAQGLRVPAVQLTAGGQPPPTAAGTERHDHLDQFLLPDHEHRTKIVSLHTGEPRGNSAQRFNLGTNWWDESVAGAAGQEPDGALNDEARADRARLGVCEDLAVPESDLAAAAAAVRPLTQVVEFTRWVGTGRKLTQTGRLTMADARQLVSLLGTGDEIDPAIGDKVFRTRSSEELRGLTIVVQWAKAAGLVRVVHGRLVPVKKNATLLSRPLALWTAMFEAFGQLGGAVCPSGWFRSLFGDDFGDGVAIMFAGLAESDGAIKREDANELVWAILIRRYETDGVTDDQLRRWRALVDRDVRLTAALLAEFGAFTEDTETLRLTALARRALRRGYDAETAAEPIAQLKVTLLDTDPSVWRRVLVPAAIRLDRLHEVIQAAMGWTNSHLHMFTHSSGQYGFSEPELMLKDDRKTTLRDLAAGEGDMVGYEYDFGDSWEHEIIVEKVLAADPDVQYPVCVAGESACPPEDCGGTGGYRDLIETLDDPTDPEHESMLMWLGLDSSSEFDPARFDIDGANRRLNAASLRGYPQEPS